MRVNEPTGTINPGVVYMAESYQLGVEAIIPLDRASGDDIGVIGNVTGAIVPSVPFPPTRLLTKEVVLDPHVPLGMPPGTFVTRGMTLIIQRGNS